VRRVARFGWALAALLAFCPRSPALDPALDANQYGHTSWKVRDGFFDDAITSIAQTPDGYLWLGTQFALLRFDGVRHVVWQPPAGQQLPHNFVRSLCAARDGRLWIGTQLGLASWKDGQLTLHPELTGQAIGRILEDRDGTIWAGTRGPPPGRICAFRSGGAQCYGEGKEFGNRAAALYEDRRGNLWVGAQKGLWRWKPDPPRFYPLENPSEDIENSQGIVEMDDGALLIAERNGLKHLIDERVVAYHPPVEGLRLEPGCLLRDHDGGVWIGTYRMGLVHVHQGRADLFSQRDGLTGDYIRCLFEDREGNIWVATANGLDRFRHTAARTVTVELGLSNDTAWSLLAARDGSVWAGTLKGLNRLKDGQITIYRKRGPAGVIGDEAIPQPGGAGAANQPGPRGAVREIADEGLPNDTIQSLFEDDRQRIWVSTKGGVAYFENDRFIPVSGTPGGVHAITGDAAGNIWISEEENLVQVRGGRVIEQIPWARLERRNAAYRMLTDPVRGGLWLGFRDGAGLAFFQDGSIRDSYGVSEGIHHTIGNLRLDADGTLWAATGGGLSRLKGGRVHTLTAKNGLPSDLVNWVIEDDDRCFWLYTARGLARVARAEVEAWAAAAEKDKDTKHRVQATVFDIADGVRVHSAHSGFTPQVGKTPDGRLWFLPRDGVSVIDPRHIPFNPLPPRVHVERITADGEVHDPLPGLRLPPLVRDLAIDFTALSLTAPEKIRFRYQLEGQDPEWKEVAGERRAHYSNLPPRRYRFRVSACNNSGVWDEEGDFLDFAIAPAYYQTNWFRALCGVAVLALLLGLYQWRIRQVRRHEKQLRAVVEGMPTMAFSIRADGSPEFVNKRWRAYSGLSTDATADGRGWEATLHPDDVEVHLNKWRAALSTGDPFAYGPPYRRGARRTRPVPPPPRGTPG
jgi:ligand-binding sensor domain-containing protein